MFDWRSVFDWNVDVSNQPMRPRRGITWLRLYKFSNAAPLLLLLLLPVSCPQDLCPQDLIPGVTCRRFYHGFTWILVSLLRVL